MGSTRNTTANLLTLAEKDAEEDRPWGQTGHDLPRTHVPPAVGAVVAQPVQQRAVNLSNVLFAHDLVWGPFCAHTDGLANTETKNGKQTMSACPGQCFPRITSLGPGMFFPTGTPGQATSGTGSESPSPLRADVRLSDVFS